MHKADLKETSDKILLAATNLFANKHFDTVSIREISNAAKVNSALISYYFGGKKQLYRAVINTQADKLHEVINNINAQDMTINRKIVAFCKAVNELQIDNRNTFSLLYRELLTPSGLGDDLISTKLKCFHDFFLSLIGAAISEKRMRDDIRPEYIAFSIEGLIILFFLTSKELLSINSLAPGNENVLLEDVLTSYINVLSPTGGKDNE